ncbi:MAG: hybrid sensor histidine kinase/response regulator [Melioribacteraceae bacterium]|jgi:two-component system sensor histidine kinase/response regulator|nr:hybrid sensor histidine kinase/response regulator [Melioribacteraceae bacterium]
MNESILFVDDDENLLHSYLRQFKKKYNVQTAASGGEAIRIILEGKQFPVIISDFSMPLMNGIEFFEAIKNISPNTIKILVTGNADINIAIDSINKGNIFRFIPKPFEKRTLSKAIEDALHQYKLTSIEKSDLLKNEFLNIISHEIRTPLSGITSFVDLIKEELNDEVLKKVQPYIEIVDENTKRLVRTIHLMIDISEVMSKNIKLKYDQVNIVADILNPLLSTYGVKAATKEISIDLNMDASEYKTISDKYCLEQIFSNIIDNALKFTNDKLIAINITGDDSNIFVEISDSGIGIEEDFQRIMFNPFVQNETGNSRTYDGNGLGLTLVKEYCQLINIIINLESKKNIGTTFQLIIKRDI